MNKKGANKAKSKLMHPFIMKLVFTHSLSPTLRIHFPSLIKFEGNKHVISDFQWIFQCIHWLTALEKFWTNKTCVEHMEFFIKLGFVINTKICFSPNIGWNWFYSKKKNRKRNRIVLNNLFQWLSFQISWHFSVT